VRVLGGLHPYYTSIQENLRYLHPERLRACRALKREAAVVAASIKTLCGEECAGYPGLDIAIVSLQDRLHQVATRNDSLDTNLRADDVGLNDVIEEVEEASRHGVQFRIGQLIHGRLGDHDYLRDTPISRQLLW
jgi:hypothetical protein